MRLLSLLMVWTLLLWAGAVQAEDVTATPDTSTLVADCTRLLAADRPIPTGPDAPSIRFVQPMTSVIYGQTVTIEVTTTNFDINSEGNHWHLWVNGQLQGMVYQPTAIIDLPPGTYQICATMGDANHVDIGIPAAMEITMQAAAAGTPTPTLAVAREAAQVRQDSVSAGQIALIVGGGLLAAVGGWWLGKRMPKSSKL
jgi:hypothetical protein